MNNITYSHEHMLIDLSKGKNNPDCYLNVLNEAIDEISNLYNLGVRRIVDCSNNGIGKDYSVLEEISKITGVEIVKSTGFYKDPFLPDYFAEASVDDLIEIMMEDIKNGARVIGEIGTSKDVITENEKKLFEACSKLHKITSLPIITHTTLGTCAKEQVQIFKENGVDLSKVIISHLSLKNDCELILDILNEGCNVAFDTIGKNNYLLDEIRVEFIKNAIDSGYVNNILMSMDLTRQSHLKKNGGVGYDYLITKFVPLLIENGVSEKDIETIMCENFTRILGD